MYNAPEVQIILVWIFSVFWSGNTECSDTIVNKTPTTIKDLSWPVRKWHIFRSISSDQKINLWFQISLRLPRIVVIQHL